MPGIAPGCAGGCVLETKKPDSVRTWLDAARISDFLLRGRRLAFGLGGFGGGRGGGCFVPLESAAQAFLEIYWSGIAEERARCIDIGLRIANVAVAIWLVLGFH